MAVLSGAIKSHGSGFRCGFGHGTHPFQADEPLRILSPNQKEEVQAATFEVLEDTGIVIENGNVKKNLARSDANALRDMTTRLV